MTGPTKQPSSAYEAAKRIISDIQDDDPDTMTTLEADALCVAEEILSAQSYRKTATELAKRVAKAEMERDQHIERWEIEHGEALRWQQKAQQLSYELSRAMRSMSACGVNMVKVDAWDWQPIETAPRDGTRVYLAYDTGPNSWDWDIALCRFHSIGWYLSPNGEIGNPIHFNPTHWARIGGREA